MRRFKSTYNQDEIIAQVQKKNAETHYMSPFPLDKMNKPITKTQTTSVGISNRVYNAANLRLRKPDPPKKKVKVKWVNKEFLDMVETVKNNKHINDL